MRTHFPHVAKFPRKAVLIPSSVADVKRIELVIQRTICAASQNRGSYDVSRKSNRPAGRQFCCKAINVTCEAKVEVLELEILE
jgi:hypothetical protein